MKFGIQPSFGGFQTPQAVDVNFPMKRQLDASALQRPTLGNGISAQDLRNNAQSAGFDYQNVLAQTAANSRALAQLANDLGDIRAALSTHGVGAMGGMVSAGNRNANLAAYAAPPKVGKGGILETEFATFTAASPANTTEEASITNATRARLTDTYWEYAALVAEGDLADRDELRKIQVTVLVNGNPIPTLFRVPADVFADSLDGPQLIPVNEYIGSDADIEVIFETQRALTTASDADIGIRIYSGNGSTYRHIVGG